MAGQQRSEQHFHPVPPRGKAGKAPVPLAIGIANGIADRLQPRPGARPAQHHVQLAHPLEPGGAAFARHDQRMAKQRQEPHRRGTFCPGLRQLQQQAPGDRLRQGPAGGIIGGNVPAAEMGDHPLRQAAIRGDHRHPPFGHGQCLAHQNGDGLRLFLGMGAVHQAHTRQTPFGRRQLDPGRARLGRQEQIGNGPAARRRGCGNAGAVPIAHIVARKAHAMQQ